MRSMSTHGHELLETSGAYVSKAVCRGSSGNGLGLEPQVEHPGLTPLMPRGP